MHAQATPEESQATQETPVATASPSPSPSIHCDDYLGHQLEHRRDGDRFVCDRCEPREPDDADLLDPDDVAAEVRAAFPEPSAAIA